MVVCSIGVYDIVVATSMFMEFPEELGKSTKVYCLINKDTEVREYESLSFAETYSLAVQTEALYAQAMKNRSKNDNSSIKLLN